MQLNFFNTIHLKGEELKEEIVNCSKQEERIMALMGHGHPLTPAEVHESYSIVWGGIPITSIRRAMTCLTEKGKLEKLDEMKPGNFGKMNHKWRIK